MVFILFLYRDQFILSNQQNLIKIVTLRPLERDGNRSARYGFIVSSLSFAAHACQSALETGARVLCGTETTLYNAKIADR